jgi:hypothetical protein
MPFPTAALPDHAEEFYTKSNFTFFGFIDGKRTHLQCPADAGSVYYVYKCITSWLLKV